MVLVGAGPVSAFPSLLQADNDLSVGGTQVGPGGEGTLTIRNGGSVTVANNMWVWGFGSGDRGVLAVDSTYSLTVTNTLNFSGGRLHFLEDGVDFINDVYLDNVPGPDLNGMIADTDANKKDICLPTSHFDNRSSDKKPVLLYSPLLNKNK